MREARACTGDGTPRRQPPRNPRSSLRRRADNDTTSAEQRQAAITAFNDGAQALTAFADEADSSHSAALLDKAAARFAAALEANPFDEDAHFWLARVYELQADALGQAGAIDAAIAVLQKLVSMQGHRPGYIALLAEAHERQGNARVRSSRRGALAAGRAGNHRRRCTGSRWAYCYRLRGSVHTLCTKQPRLRASCAQRFGPGGLGISSMRGRLLEATRAYLNAERQWILWDNGNLQTRTRFDALLGLASSDPENAAIGLEALLAEVQSDGARIGGPTRTSASQLPHRECGTRQ